MNKIKIATSNKNKIIEIESILGADTLEPIDVDLTEIQDIDSVVVVKAKAKEAYSLLGEGVITEDTSLKIDSMGEMPGPLIKWFFKGLGNDGLIKATDYKNRKAVATVILCLYDGDEYIIGRGDVEGSISMEAKGQLGFGWDPIFIPDGQSLTFGEMSLEEKNKFSMRRMATDDLFKKFKLN